MDMGRGFLWRHRAAGALARRPFARPRHRAYTDQQPVRSIRSVLIDYRAVLSVLRAPLRHACAGRVRTDGHQFGRSEEHTSELQSLMRISYAVFCLKKKTTRHKINISIPGSN